MTDDLICACVLQAVRPSGVVAVVGLGHDDVTIPITDAVLREIDIRGCVCNNYW